MTTKELLALVGKATPGPWEADSDSVYHDDSDGPHIVGDIVCMDPGLQGHEESAKNFPANAALIVAAVNALPALCAEVEALRKDADRYRVLRDYDWSQRTMSRTEWIAGEYGEELDRLIDAAKEPK